MLLKSVWFRGHLISLSIHCAALLAVLVGMGQPTGGAPSEHNMVDERESELELSGLLSALSFGASFEELANFLIDRIDVHYAAPSHGHTLPTALRG
jgi:hypothetical protein